MEKIVAFDQSPSLDDFTEVPGGEQRGNAARERSGNISRVTSANNLREINVKRGFMVRSEGTRTPTILLTATSRQRVYQFRHERSSKIGAGTTPNRTMAGDVTNRR